MDAAARRSFRASEINRNAVGASEIRAGATTLISRPAADNVGNGGIPDLGGDEFAFWKGSARTETNVAATMRVFAVCASAPAAAP